MVILEKNGISRISLYNEYEHNQLINKKLSQQWIDWYIEENSDVASK